MLGTETLPPHFLEKMRLQWSEISNAFNNMDMCRAGKLSRSDFEAMSKRTGLRLTQGEIDEIVRVFDKNKDGKVDFREFASVIGDYLKPSSQPTGFSLNFSADARRQTGKKMLPRKIQTMDTDDSEKPLIQVRSKI